MQTYVAEENKDLHEVVQVLRQELHKLTLSGKKSVDADAESNEDDWTDVDEDGDGDVSHGSGIWSEAVSGDEDEFDDSGNDELEEVLKIPHEMLRVPEIG